MLKEKRTQPPEPERHNRADKKTKKRLAEVAGIPAIGMQHSHSPEHFRFGDEVEFAKTVDITLKAIY